MAETSNSAFYHLLMRHLDAGQGHRIAYREGARSVGFAELERLSAKAAALLRSAGVGPGDRVLTCADDSIAHIALALGALRLGAVMVLVNHLYPAHKLRFFCRDSAARTLVVSALTARHLVDWSERPAQVRALWYVGDGDPPAGVPRLEEALALAPCEDAIEQVPRDHPACWQYTHGSDGEELAVVHTHQAFIAGADPFARGRLALGQDDVCFSLAKLYFGYGFGNSFIFPLAVGGSALLYAGRPDVYSILGVVERERPTVFFGVPTFYQSILKLPDVATRFDLSSVRTFVSAGEELGAALAERFHATFGSWLVDGIGSTEMFHIFLSGAPGEARPGALGTITPGHEARLLAPDGRPVPDGEPGELWVRGPHNGAGYACHPERTRSVFVDGWIRVGDRLVRDASGEHRYGGRLDDLAMVGGQKVLLDEVRQHLVQHEAVADVQVTTSHDEDRICRLSARVWLHPGVDAGRATQQRLRAHLREHLLPHSCPATLDLMTEPPPARRPDARNGTE